MDSYASCPDEDGKDIAIKSTLNVWKRLRAANPSNPTGKNAFRVLKWLCRYWIGSAKVSEDFVELISTLIHQTNIIRWRVHARRKLYVFYDSLDDTTRQDFLKKLLNLDGGLLPFGILMDYLNETQTSEKILNADGMPTREDIVNRFITASLLFKHKQPPSANTLDSANVLRHFVTEDLFKNLLLPAIQKALLRSPETTLRVVGSVLNAASIDLNNFAVELSNLFTAVLRSQSEEGKPDAIFVTGILASKISSSSNMKEALEVYFGTLCGMEGKLATSVSKINFLKAIKTMANCGISDKDLISISTYVLEKCITVLESEVHEGTALECLEVMRIWSSKLGTELPSSLQKYITKNFKSIKGALRFHFFSLMASVFVSERIHHVGFILPEIDKWLNQPTSTAPSTFAIEALPLLVVELRNCQENKIPEDSITLAKTVLSDIVSKKTECCSLSSLCLLEIVYHLVPTYLDKIGNVVFDAAVLVLTQTNYQVRKDLRHLFKLFLLKISADDVKTGFIPSLMTVFKSRGISGHIVEEIIKFIVQTCGGVWSRLELERLAIELIYLAHGCHQEQYWLGLVWQLHLPAKELIESNWKTLNQKYVIEFDQNVVTAKVVRTCIAIGGTTVSKGIVAEFFKIFNTESVLKITQEEYLIFTSKLGDLCDASVLQDNKVNDAKLRPDLDKYKKPSKVDLSIQKKKELMKAQLEREAEIRERVQCVDTQIKRVTPLFETALEENVNAFAPFMPEIIDLLLKGMRSPLGSPYAVSIFEKIGVNTMEEYLGALVSQITIRLNKPSNESTTKPVRKEELERCMKTALKLVRNAVESDLFSCGAFSFCFPLFSLSARRYAQDSGVFLLVLECIITFLKKLTVLESYTSPVPRGETCKLLYAGFASHDNAIQQKCLFGLLELSKSSHFALADNSRTDEMKQHVQALFSSLSSLRDAGIRSLAIVLRHPTSMTPEDLELLKSSVYRTKFDEDAEIRDLAEQVWTATGYDVDTSFTEELLQNITYTNESVRRAAAKALVSIVQAHSDQVEHVLQELFVIYNEHLAERPAIVDTLGRILEPAMDKWEGRHGVGNAIKDLTPHLSPTMVNDTFGWLLKVGMRDRNVDVHNMCLDAAVDMANVHGKQFLTDFVTLVESYLDVPKGSANEDSFQEACVILMGCLASHLDPSDSRIMKIFSTLVDTLSTPSEKVQEAVANCLPALVPALGADATAVMTVLLNDTMESNTYGGRRGAAYGLAGLVKGMGILSLKQNNVMNILAEGLQDKKNYRRKEGCLMALELLCNFLGRLFEPYIVHVLPHLLQCLGDTNTYVREATENTAKCLMSRLSGHGVKLVLPALLNALNEDSWRTKCGSVDLLGRMAFCAPKQLSGCLPMIVPHLIDVLSDSHVKVQEAAVKALGLIGSVIRNPEIQTVVPVLIEALEDPSKRTHKCMQALLKTEFVHFVDPPSLALIMPVVQRAFQDRSTETRRMASQIIGNMYSLTDHSDLIPYMNSVMPGLKTSLTDPVPEVRSVAAKALGSMSKGLGEKCYDEILPWLMKTLVSETSAVDRSGAAQGLAEVIGALGEDKLQRFMPEIIRKADSDEIAPHVRDGYMMMFIYMPSVFEEDFIPYIGQILNPILKALADENEFVRDTALKAGQRIVAGYADTAITLLLPELEKGIFDNNWRIRFSSVQLLGDLLYKISGVSGKMSTESSSDDDNFGTEIAQNVITETLGLERRNRVLAGLYIERSDVALMVRQAALHVWKVVVANTPKTLREILKTLFSLLLNLLASSSHDKRQVAARTLGDLVRKLGEKILSEVLPLLERGLESSVAAERQGVCVGLSEIMTSTSREMVLVFVDNLVPTLRKGLCDSDPDVRATAAHTFGSLHSTIGSRALEEVIPFMLKKINDPEEGDNALYGLGQLVLVRSKSVMPYVIPHLLSPPVNLRALAILSSVSGEAVSRHLQKILPTLLGLLKTPSDAANQEQTVKSCGQVLLSITDEDGVRSLINELLGYCHSDHADKVPGILLLSIFCAQTKADLIPYIPELIKCFILQLVIEDTAVLRYIVDALTTLIKDIEPSEQPGYVGTLHQALRFVKADLKNEKYLPGLCIPKGINSVLPVLREALLNGPAEVKEAAANGMYELITLTSPEALKPVVILITGPLIRILGDRYGPHIKVAVIETLTLLLERAGQHLKAFLPQLQTTFLKGSVDPNRNVRLQAASALIELVQIHPKPDPLFLELANAIKTTEDTGVRDTALATLKSILSLGADKMNDTTRKVIGPVLSLQLNSSDKSVRALAEDCLGFIA